MTMCGVYKITCIPLNQCYIGSSINIAKRWSVHRTKLKNGYHPNKALQRAFDCYGEVAFEYEIIQELPATVTRNELRSIESYWIIELRSLLLWGTGFNILDTLYT